MKGPSTITFEWSRRCSMNSSKGLAQELQNKIPIGEQVWTSTLPSSTSIVCHIALSPSLCQKFAEQSEKSIRIKLSNAQETLKNGSLLQMTLRTGGMCLMHVVPLMENM